LSHCNHQIRWKILLNLRNSCGFLLIGVRTRHIMGQDYEWLAKSAVEWGIPRPREREIALTRREVGESRIPRLVCAE